MSPARPVYRVHGALDFGGDEIYFYENAELVGRAFSDVLGEFRTSSLIGIVPVGEQPHLNPLMDRSSLPAIG